MGAKLSRLLGYSSVKFIRVENWKLGAVYYSLVLLVSMYILVYSLILSKGYQQYDTVVGTATLKVKGTGYVNNSHGVTVFDSYDVINPATEQNALFLTTSFLRTMNQTRGICPGNDNSSEACQTDQDCYPYKPTFNGIQTGLCDSTVGFCYLYAWCPLENPLAHSTHLSNIDQFSVFIKVNSLFPKFSYIADNVADGLVPLYNQFTPQQMLSLAGFNFNDIATKGAILLCQMDFNCDLNSHSNCNPDVTFTRIDNPSSSSFSSGFNYRYITMSTNPDGTQRRDLVKVMGLRLLFDFHGTAGKFSLVVLFITFGAGVGLLGVSTVVCDFILQYFMPRKKKYLSQKYEHVLESPSVQHYHSLEHKADGTENNLPKI